MDSTPDQFFNDHIFKLNESQKLALYNCCTNKFSIVQGPPGTGKTTMTAVYINCLKDYYEAKKKLDPDINKKRNEKILIVSDSNKAVDNLCLKLLELGTVNVVRIMSRKARNKPDIDPKIDQISHEMNTE